MDRKYGAGGAGAVKEGRSWQSSRSGASRMRDEAAIANIGVDMPADNDSLRKFLHVS